jgi:dynein heavy chain, axonemal
MSTENPEEASTEELTKDSTDTDALDVSTTDETNRQEEATTAPSAALISSPVPETKRSVVSEYDPLISWVVQRLKLVGVTDESELSSFFSNESVIDFVTGSSPKLIAVVVSPDDSDKVSLFSDFREDMTGFFLRSDSSPLTRENIDRQVQFGTIGGGSLSFTALERMMKGLVDKQISQNSALTDGARNELSGHYHKCMATLTDTIYCGDGKTVLYCPAFDTGISVVDAARNKDMVQIIESIVIRWTQQIKNVVNNAEQAGKSEISGPLDEINNWKVRAQDLLGMYVISLYYHAYNNIVSGSSLPTHNYFTAKSRFRVKTSVELWISLYTRARTT